MTKSTGIFGLALAAIVLGGADVGAQGKSKDKDKDKDKQHKVADVKHDGHVIGDARRVPPGLAKKPGQMPPGQYKKRYGANQGATVLSDILRKRGYVVVRTVPEGTSQLVYYRLADGTERRAIVRVGEDRLRFSNVPATILQQVLAALY